ncbi:CubicO group peptidase (beta-lactamase class C family) [Virgibacillus halotolerans]|uniref:serine hydrolase domain-containing protein n=1 Tax=Virgibacillus halotolerans TaxID=1071053 RepID=UPI0019602433|nr:serine hydrolase [Virgibacillus halotolerans]MBM7599000.1 CubicO group peptidase (beta-lactamase class C family) [Virgibacillus halotolerans]
MNFYRHSNEKIGTINNIYDGNMFPDTAINTFRNIERLFPTRTIPASSKPKPLKKSSLSLHSFKSQIQDFSVKIADQFYDIYDYLALNSITGIVVLKNGKLVYENYLHGNGPDTRWMSMSVAKSITSTLVGIAIKDGYISSIDDLTVKYVPELKGSAYEDTTVRQILGMNSGVKWDETYTNPKSDRRNFLEAQTSQKPGSLIEVLRKLPRVGEPGAVHNYSTGETTIASEIVIGATKKKLSDYLSEKLWEPYGMEGKAEWWLDSIDGNEIGGSGFSAVLRDYARFGQFFLDKGKIEGESILPEYWFDLASQPTILKNGESVNYGLMWWPAWTEKSKQRKAFQAIGIHGQVIHIDPHENVVIAISSARPKPLGTQPIDDMLFLEELIENIK